MHYSLRRKGGVRTQCGEGRRIGARGIRGPFGRDEGLEAKYGPQRRQSWSRSSPPLLVVSHFRVSRP